MTGITPALREQFFNDWHRSDLKLVMFLEAKGSTLSDAEKQWILDRMEIACAAVRKLLGNTHINESAKPESSTSAAITSSASPVDDAGHIKSDDTSPTSISAGPKADLTEVVPPSDHTCAREMGVPDLASSRTATDCSSALEIQRNDGILPAQAASSSSTDVDWPSRMLAEMAVASAGLTPQRRTIASLGSPVRVSNLTGSDEEIRADPFIKDYQWLHAYLGKKNVTDGYPGSGPTPSGRTPRYSRAELDPYKTPMFSLGTTLAAEIQVYSLKVLPWSDDNKRELVLLYQVAVQGCWKVLNEELQAEFRMRWKQERALAYSI